MFCVLVTFRFQLPPLASSNVKKRAKCVSLSLPVQSLSFDKPYSDTGIWAPYGPRLNYKDSKEVCPHTCNMQAHRKVEYALVLMNRPPAMGQIVSLPCSHIVDRKANGVNPERKNRGEAPQVDL